MKKELDLAKPTGTYVPYDFLKSDVRTYAHQTLKNPAGFVTRKKSPRARYVGQSKALIREMKKFLYKK